MSPSLTPADLAELGKRALVRKPPASAPRRQPEAPKSPVAMSLHTPRRPESALVKELVRALRAIGCVAVRQNVGAVQDGGRFVRFGLKGCSDILGIVPVRCLCVYQSSASSRATEIPYPYCVVCEGRGTVGLALAVECKSDAGQLRPAQQAFLAMVNEAGGLGLVARSVDDVVPLVLRRMGQR